MENNLLELVKQMEQAEKELCNFPLVFAEMLKNEINAHDEQHAYKGFKKVIKKYAEDPKSMAAINDFFDAITGGASLEEIMNIAIEEGQDPSITSEMMIDDSCSLDK